MHARKSKDRVLPKSGFADFQIKLSNRHGPSSWDGVVESAATLNVGSPILLRTTDLRFELHPGERLRLLNVHVSMPSEEFVEAKAEPLVATMGANSEAFLLPT